MKSKSLKLNALLNGIKTGITMIFPLITFPYISRILDVENIGKINFSNSVVNYFLLIAGLGISTYAIREGSYIRDDKDKLNRFCNEVFTINLLSTLISYILLIIIVSFNSKLQTYKLLIVIYSVNIIGTTIGINWLYSIYEDYWYITVRSILFQIISLVLMFIFVKTEQDYIKYVWILMMSSTGANILNYFNAKKYIQLKISKSINIKSHIKPILIIFISTIATTIYVNSDSTMLGFMCDNYTVGIYSVSVKIYTIFKSFVASIILVALPRLSNYIADKLKSDYEDKVNKIYRVLFILLIPITVGLYMSAKDIILIISGFSYIDATTSLRILSVALLFSVIGIYYTNAILLPMKYENEIMKITLISACVNIILNLIIIPNYKQNGAAATTIISEFIVCLMQYRIISKNMKLKLKKNDLLIMLLGSISIIFVCNLLDYINIMLYNKLILKVIISGILYLIILKIFKSDIFNLLKFKKEKLNIEYN